MKIETKLLSDELQFMKNKTNDYAFHKRPSNLPRKNLANINAVNDRIPQSNLYCDIPTDSTEVLVNASLIQDMKSQLGKNHYNR